MNDIESHVKGNLRQKTQSVFNSLKIPTLKIPTLNYVNMIVKIFYKGVSKIL